MAPVRRQISPHAARLRREMTDVERKLWGALRNRQLGDLKWRRQASVGRYIVDFLCIEAMLIVELDGGQHTSEGDAARTAALEAAGYEVLRFWNSDIVESFGGVCETILAAAGRRRRPHPTLSREGRERALRVHPLPHPAPRR